MIKNIKKGIYLQTMLLFTNLLIQLIRTDEVSTEKNEETLIKNLSFKKVRDGVNLTVFLTREIHPSTINIMESKEPSDPNSFTVAATIEDDVFWEANGNRFSYVLEESLLKKKDMAFSVQIEEGKQLYHSEAFVYDQDEKNCVFARNAKTTSNAGWIVALVLSAVALLICIILVFIKFCT